ncbi:ATP-binding cassette domain-containing protein [Desulfobacula sp.]|uniref:ATP-binding cassette domain-containing protein n=1 Tax=Desulfobacula sp. TaxID=2593537 RepID=UPI00260804D9|nr:ATP-binding cassette domain-containing protein [Desulfobacula sp.]
MAFILETKDLTKQFGGLTAVDKTSLKLKEGGLRCILGPNGCGKTTLFNLISGCYKPTSGKIIFAGQDISGQPVHLINRAGIGRKFQIPSVFNSMTVEENLRVPSSSNWKPSLLRSKNSVPGNRQEILTLLNLLKLTEKTNELAGNLSHGEKQWLEIGMVMASKPRLMLLDEPTAGMTAAETNKTAQLIHQISIETGISVVVIEHDLNFVKKLASRVTVMYKGSIFREGNYEEIQEDKDVQSIYLGRKR